MSSVGSSGRWRARHWATTPVFPPKGTASLQRAERKSPVVDSKPEDTLVAHPDWGRAECTLEHGSLAASW